MEIEEITLAKKAFISFNKDTRENISEIVLEYIKTRLFSNKVLLEELSQNLNEDFDFNSILEVLNHELASENVYKKTQKFERLTNGFNRGTYATSKGLILVETDNLEDIVKYYARAIKSRNSITIAATNYNELSLASTLLVIFCESLAKYNIDRNLIIYMPFEECFPSYFDEVISIDEGKQIKEKEISNRVIIYKENHDFDEEITNELRRLDEKGINYKILENVNYEDAVNEINKEKPIGVAIYTKNQELGISFIDEIHSPNVFINASLTNIETENLLSNELYMKKQIIYPSNQLGKEFDVDEEDRKIEENAVSNNDKTEEKIIEEETITEEKEKAEETIEKTLEETKDLTLPVTPWYRKILNAIKNIFRK